MGCGQDNHFLDQSSPAFWIDSLEGKGGAEKCTCVCARNGCVHCGGASARTHALALVPVHMRKHKQAARTHGSTGGSAAACVHAQTGR